MEKLTGKRGANDYFDPNGKVKTGQLTETDTNIENIEQLKKEYIAYSNGTLQKMKKVIKDKTDGLLDEVYDYFTENNWENWKMLKRISANVRKSEKFKILNPKRDHSHVHTGMGDINIRLMQQLNNTIGMFIRSMMPGNHHQKQGTRNTKQMKSNSS